MRNEYLRFFFHRKFSKYCSDTKLLNTTFDELLDYYSTPKRYYHDLTHIISLLKLFEKHQQALHDDEAVFAAIWFHDAIYDAWKSDNEEKSADWARTFLEQIAFPNLRIEKVVQYIVATKTHESNGDNDLNYFLDFDLAILSAEPEIYDVYTQQIQDEFSFYPTFLYKRGRRKVLQSFLDKKTIYKTDFFYKNFESLARLNIQRELDAL